MPMPMPMPGRIRDFILICCGALIIFGVIDFFGRRQFGAFDSSALIDVGYRIYLGQKPYHDFFQATPPLFSMGAGYAFKWFGLSWGSLVRISAIWAITCFVLQLWLLVRMGISFLRAWVLSFIFAALSFFPLSYWWYNSITSSLCTLLFTSTLSLLMQAKSRALDFALWGALLTLTSISKPNAAALTMMSCSAALILSETKRKRAFFTIFLSVIAAVLVLRLAEVNILDMISSYLSISGRAYPSVGRFTQDQRSYVVVLSVLMILASIGLFLTFIRKSFPGIILSGINTQLSLFLIVLSFLSFNPLLFIAGATMFFCGSLFPNERLLIMLALLSSVLATLWVITHKEASWLAVGLIGYGLLSAILYRASFERSLKIVLSGCFICAFFCFFTNGEFKTTDLPMLAVPLLAIIEVTGLAKARSLDYFKFGLILFMFLVIAVFTVTRERIRSVGPFFSSRSLVNLGNENKFFKDVMASEEMLSVLIEIRRVLQSDRLRLLKKGVFFGPRLQFAYAAFKRSPPLGLPSWWAPGVTYAESQIAEMEKKFFNASFDVCVFWRQDFTYLSGDFRSQLDDLYKVIHNGIVTVYVKKVSTNKS